MISIVICLSCIVIIVVRVKVIGNRKKWWFLLNRRLIWLSGLLMLFGSGNKLCIILCI